MKQNRFDVSTHEFSLRFLSFVRAFQERNQFIVRAYKTDMLPVESHILTEIDSHGMLTGAELAEYLTIAPARISLLVKKLRAKKVIQLFSNNDESLRKPYRLTASGRRVLKDIDQQADTQLNGMTEIFSIREIEDLANFFRLLSDGVGAPSSSQRSAEHPLRFVARRLTRWLGQLGNNFFESGISALDWHVIQAIRDGEGIVVSSELAERFNASKQLISKSLKRLEESNLVTRRLGVKDRRQKLLKVTTRGNTLLNSLEQRSSERILRALRGIPARYKGKQVYENAYLLVGLAPRT